MVRGKAEADEPTKPPVPRQSLSGGESVHIDERPDLAPMTLPPSGAGDDDESKIRDEVPMSTIYRNSARSSRVVQNKKERQRESGTLREAPMSTIYGSTARISRAVQDKKERQGESSTLREAPTSSTIYGNRARSSRAVKDKDAPQDHSQDQLGGKRTNENNARRNWLARRAAATAALFSRQNFGHRARTRWKADNDSSPIDVTFHDSQTSDARNRWRASKGRDTNTPDELDHVVLQEPSREEGTDPFPVQDEEAPSTAQHRQQDEIPHEEAPSTMQQQQDGIPPPEVLPTATPVLNRPVASEPQDRSEGGGSIAVATEAKWWDVFKTRRSLIGLIGLLLVMGGVIGGIVYAVTSGSSNDAPPPESGPEEAPSPSATPTPTMLVLEQIGQSIVNDDEPIESGPRGQRYFGWVVELSADGNRLVATAPYDRKVHVYDLSVEDDLWIQSGEILVPSGFVDHIVLSDSGTILAIGVPLDSEKHEKAGMVQVYAEASPGTWVAMGDPIYGNSEGDMIGGFSQPDGNLPQRPSEYDDDFEYRDESVPFSLDGYDSSSMALSEDGQILAIGSSRGNYVSVFFFDNTASQWKDMGSPDFVGEARGDKFGTSVDLSADGRRIVIGAPDNLGKAGVEWAIYTGNVRVFEYQQETDSWRKLGQDLEGDREQGDRTNGLQGEQAGSGVSISADGTVVAVSSNFHSDSEDIYALGDNDGNVKVYRYAESRDEWIQVGNTVNIFQFGLELVNDFQGQFKINAGLQSEKYPIVSRLSRDGKRLAVSVLAESLNGDIKGRGVVRLYELRGESWRTIGTPIEGASDWDHSGRSISISYNGTRVAVGAPRHNSEHPDDGQVRVFQLEGTTITPLPTTTFSVAPSATPGPPVPLTLALDLDNRPEDLAWFLKCDGATYGNMTEGSYSGTEFQGANITQTFLVPGGSLCMLSVSEVQHLKNFRVYYGEGITEGLPVILDTAQMAGFFSRFNFPFFVTSRTAAIFVSIQLDGNSKETTISLDCGGFPFVKGLLLNESPFTLSNVTIMGINEGAMCVFTIEDSFGDGGCCGGYYEIYYGASAGGNLLAAGGQFAARENVSFVISPNADPVTKPPTQPPTLSPGATISPTRSPWTQVGQILNAKASDDLFGSSLLLSRDGNVMAVGAKQSYLNPGYVVVQRYNQATLQWSRIGQELIGDAVGDRFGESVSLNGNGTIVAIGALENDSGGENAGHVRVYEYVDGTDRWIQLGRDIDGQDAGDSFGVSVSMSDSGSILAVGASQDDTDNGFNTGSVRVFQYKRGTRAWNQLGQTLLGEASADGFGESLSLSSSGTIVAIGAPENDAGGRYNAGQVSVFQYDPQSSSWEPLGDPANGLVEYERFGSSLSLDDSGTIMAVGGPGSAGRVSVFVYDRAISEWTSRGQALVSRQDGESFGAAVSLSSKGNILAVGSPRYDVNPTNVNRLVQAGEVTVFHYSAIATSWIQFGEGLVGEAESRFGSSVSVSFSESGTLVGVGAPQNGDNGDDSGSVYVFQAPFIVDSDTAVPTRSPVPTPPQPTITPTRTLLPSQIPFDEWRPLGQVLNGKASSDYFGVDESIAVSLDGSVVAVGAKQSSGPRSGYVSVFRMDLKTKKWASMGDDLLGKTSEDNFGESVSLNGDGSILAVGSDGNDSGGTNAGLVQVYEFNQSEDSWVQLGNVIIGRAPGDRSGFSVSLSDAGDILAVGAYLDDTENGENSGSVRMFRYNRETSLWDQLGQTLTGQFASDYFGNSVSLSSSGTIVGIGAYGYDTGKINNAGLVSVYELNSSTLWEPLGDLINGQEVDGWFGRSVSLDGSGSVVAVAAPGDIDDDASIGRVFVFAYDRSTTSWKRLGQILMSQQQGDLFGSSMSLSGTGSVIAVGSRWYGKPGRRENSGQVAIFQYCADKKRWLRAGDPIDGERKWDNFGSSVALSENGTVVGVGAFGGDVNGEESGSVYMFTVNAALPSRAPTKRPTSPPTIAPSDMTSVPGEWKPLGQVVTGMDSFDHAGGAISLSSDGSVMAVGADQDSGPGYVSVLRYNPDSSSWIPMGQALIGQANGDDFGSSLSLNSNGTILAVGADSNDSGGENAGRVQVYEYKGILDSWLQLGSDIDGQAYGDYVGYSVSLSGTGDVLAIGALNDDTQNGINSGSVRLFRLNRSTSSWEQLGQTLLGNVEFDYFGSAVSLSRGGTIVGVGAYGNDFGGTRTGQVLVYEYNSTSLLWEPLGNSINGSVRWGEFGRSVSLDDDGVVIAVGAPGNWEDSTLTGGVAVFEYDEASSTWTQRGQTLSSQIRHDQFGFSVSLSGAGNDIAVGSRWHEVTYTLENAGQVEIFRYDADESEWILVGEKLRGEARFDNFGFSVSLTANGTVVGVGARFSSRAGKEESGSAHAFSLN